jgi:hypothetical protein
MGKGKPNPFKNPEGQNPKSMEEPIDSLTADKDTPAGETINLDRRRFCKMLGVLAAVAGASVVNCGRSIGTENDAGPEGCEGCHVGPEGCEGCDAGAANTEYAAKPEDKQSENNS